MTVSGSTYVAANGIMSNLKINDTSELRKWKETHRLREGTPSRLLFSF